MLLDRSINILLRVNENLTRNRKYKLFFCLRLVGKKLLLVLFFCLTFTSWSAAENLGVTEQLLKWAELHYGQQAKSRLLEWRTVVQSNQHLKQLEKLDVVNRFFNKTRFVNDIEHWQQEDYWATPVELLATNAGDCEDFSIAKYFTLKEMGIPVERLRIAYVKAVDLNQAHMVLTYYASPDAEPLVLDNLINEIKPASDRKDLVPVYSFNGDGLWLSKQRGQGRRVGSSKGIRLWRDLGLRIEKQNNI